MISSGEVGAAVDMLMGLVTSVFLTALCLVVLVGDIKGFLLDRKLRARGYTRPVTSSKDSSVTRTGPSAGARRT